MIKKIQENEYKKVSIKNCGCYYFDDIINFEDFDFEDIFLDKKLNENFFICDLWLAQNFGWRKIIVY